MQSNIVDKTMSSTDSTIFSCSRLFEVLKNAFTNLQEQF